MFITCLFQIELVQMLTNFTLFSLSLTKNYGQSPLFTSSNRLSIKRSRFSFSFQSIIRKFDSPLYIEGTSFYRSLQTPISLSNEILTGNREAIQITQHNDEKVLITNSIFSEMNLNSPAINILSTSGVTIIKNSFCKVNSHQYSLISLSSKMAYLSKNCFVDIFAENRVWKLVNGDKVMASLNSFHNCTKSIITSSYRQVYIDTTNMSYSIAPNKEKSNDLFQTVCTVLSASQINVYECDCSYVFCITQQCISFINQINLIKQKNPGKQKTSLLLSHEVAVTVSDSCIMNKFNADDSKCIKQQKILFINCYFELQPKSAQTGQFNVVKTLQTNKIQLFGNALCQAEFPFTENHPQILKYPIKALIGFSLGPILGIILLIFIIISLIPLLKQSRRKNEISKLNNYKRQGK